MTRPPVSMTLCYETTSSVARRLGLDRRTIRGWIRRKILPEPTLIDGGGTRYFDENWVMVAQGIIDKLDGKIDSVELKAIIEEAGVDYFLPDGGEIIDGSDNNRED